MFKKQIVFFLILFMFFVTAVGQANTLNLGKRTCEVQISNFNPQSNLGDFIMLDLGYGINAHSGYGLEVVSGKVGLIELEYQFVPPLERQKNSTFNYAVKVGAVSGNYWEKEAAGGKLGVILRRKARQKEIYFGGELIAGSTILFDLELGLRGKISPGIFGVIGYKVVTSQDSGTIRGAHYGIKVDF